MGQCNCSSNTNRYVIIATASRPWTVIAGTLESEEQDTVILRDARLIVCWGPASHGLLGLATRGLLGGGRVSPTVGRVRVHGVETVLDCMDAARASIEAEPWT
jgi:hypothetical protein